MSETLMKIWLDVAQFVITAVMGFYIYLLNRSRATRNMVKHIDDRLDSVHSRVAVLEADIKRLPGDVVRIYDKLEVTNKQLSEMTGQLRAMYAQLHSINDFMIKNK